MSHDPHLGAPAAPGDSTRDRLDRCEGELVRLRGHLEAAEAANRRASRAHAELDERYAVLTRLWVAASALHEAGDEATALRAIEEVMVNLAGTEEFGVFELEPGGDLVPLHSFGPVEGRFVRHPPQGRVAEVVASGESWREESPHPRGGTGGEPVACIALRRGERVAGVVVVWGFLPQKLAFDPFDRELFALLAHRAAPALDAARLLEAGA
jgi:hypothetical protein